ncbi:MAG: hypothetical protein ABI873_07310 [Marmoricola sp.]
MNDLSRLTDRALVAQLAQIEEAIGCTPTFDPAVSGPATLNGDLLDLLAREVDIVAELRRRLASSKAGAAGSDPVPILRRPDLELAWTTSRAALGT